MKDSFVNEVLTCGSCKETNLSMIDLRTPVAASRKSSSSQTKPLPKAEEEQKTISCRSRGYKNPNDLTTVVSLHVLWYRPYEWLAMKCFSWGRMTGGNDLVYASMIGPRNACYILNQSKRRLHPPSQSDTRPRSLTWLFPRTLHRLEWFIVHSTVN